MSTHPILLLGFQPFGGHLINPSARVVEIFAQQDKTLHCHVLPVALEAMQNQVDQLLTTYQPRAVLGLGLGNGATIQLERIGINLADFGIPDASGAQPRSLALSPEQPDAFFSTLPLHDIQRDLLAHGIPAQLSNSAGTYLCNALLYHLLQRAKSASVPYIAGFFHLPSLPEMVAHTIASSQPPRPPVPSMAFSTMLRAVQIALRTIRVYFDHLKTNSNF